MAYRTRPSISGSLNRCCQPFKDQHYSMPMIYCFLFTTFHGFDRNRIDQPHTHLRTYIRVIPQLLNRPTSMRNFFFKGDLEYIGDFSGGCFCNISISGCHSRRYYSSISHFGISYNFLKFVF